MGMLDSHLHTATRGSPEIGYKHHRTATVVTRTVAAMMLPTAQFLLSASLLAILAPEDGSCANITSSPCATFACPEGLVCSLQHVWCIAAPCNPEPSCVPIKEATVRPLLTCRSTDCLPGYYCVMEQVLCKKAPCPERPRCVPGST